MTIPMTSGTPSGVLDVTSHYFEFIPEEEADAKQPTVLAAHEVEEDRKYFIVPTTAFGLYRYAIHDLVRITGFHHRTPLVEFLSKGAHFSSITGEKLYENQVIQAVRTVEEHYGHPSAFFLMLAAPRRAVYTLVYEWPSSLETPVQEMAHRIEERLRELNVEYDQKRASGRLGPLELLPVETGTGEAYKKQLIERGQREGQFKTIALQYEDDCSFVFEKFRRDRLSRSVNPA